tara:strand:- start:636 stop:1067 length:432 start_codon:yes stop_codon:yes gene_type:complete
MISKPIILFLIIISLFGCVKGKYYLEYPELRIEGQKSNQYIVNRTTDYDIGYQDGCIKGAQISLNIKKLSKDSIVGLVLDSRSKSPLPFSKVRIYFFKNEQTDTLHLTTNFKGKFSCKTQVIPDRIEVEYVGYRTLNIDLMDY